jgi:hypothetical protein
LILKIKVLLIYVLADLGKVIINPSDFIGFLYFYTIWLNLISLHRGSVKLRVGEFHLISVAGAIIQALVKSLVNASLPIPCVFLIGL